MKTESLTTYLANKYGKDIVPKRGDEFSKLIALVIGDFIKQERKAAKLTQEELAERLQTNRSYISRIERGDTDLQVSTLFKIIHFGFEKKLKISLE